MTEEEKKIWQLEQELEKLSSQLSYYRQQVNELKGSVSSKPISNEEKETYIPPQKNSSWEFPSHKQEPSTGLEGFIGLKLLHLVGIVVLVIGISIGVKYAVDKELISPFARIMLAYTAGIILYFLSVKLKRSLPCSAPYSLAALWRRCISLLMLHLFIITSSLLAQHSQRWQ